MSTGSAQVAVVLPSHNNNNVNNNNKNNINNNNNNSKNSNIIGTSSVTASTIPTAPSLSSGTFYPPGHTCPQKATPSSQQSSLSQSPPSSALPPAVHSPPTHAPTPVTISSSHSHHICTSHSSSTAGSNNSMATVATAGPATMPPTAALDPTSSSPSPAALAAATAAAAASTVSTTTVAALQKEQLPSEPTTQDSLNRQNSLGGRQRTLGGKGKHLTRSHAMRESTSPPRTPTPRSPSDQHNSSNNSGNGSSSLNYQHTLSVSATSETTSSNGGSNAHSPISDTRTFSHSNINNNNDNEYSSKQPSNSSPNIVVYGGDERGGKSQLDLDFPKLTPPKSSFISNSAGNGSSSNSSGKNSNGSRTNNNNSNAKSDSDKAEQQHGGRNVKNEEPSSGSNNYELKEPKQGGPLLDCADQSPKSSLSVSIAGTPANVATITASSTPVSSNHNYCDNENRNPREFFKETLNKNFKDRNMLMKIEKELISLAVDCERNQMKFPPMSSYNRMLIHRVAAYFGMEHNVDASQQSVIAEVTPATRIPEIRFKTLINDSFSEEPRKSILKRDTHSFDEYRYGLLHCPDRGVLDRKAKSFEEREEEYDKARRRIFKPREEGGSEEQWQWLSAENAEPINNGRPKLQNNRLLKVQSVSIEGRSDERPCVSKSHSFGGYGGSSPNAPLLRGDSITSTKSAGGRLFSKQDSNASTNTPWRLSPSSSGSYFTFSYKTQSIRSDSVTPSPTGYGSGDHTPEPCVQSPSSTCGVVWAVTDMASVPKGSVLIDPQTLQPIVNQDGSIYHFDPSNLPTTANLPGTITRAQKKKLEKHKLCNSRNNLNSSSSLESSIDTPLGKNDCGQQTSTTTTIAEEVGNEVSYDNSSTVKISTKDNQYIDENSSLCEEISQTSNELGTLKLQKHQATSPMLQASELQPLELNEIQLNANHDDHGSLAETTTPVLADSETSGALMVAPAGGGGDNVKSNVQTEQHHHHHHHHQLTDDSNDASSDNSQEAGKKEDTKQMNVVQTVPLISYSNSVTPNSNYTVNYDPGSGTPGAGTAIYASSTPGMSTTYQTAPDGTIYAVPSPLVYTYPSAMDTDMSGYFVPVYDQQRDANLCTATGASIYPTTAGAASTVLPIAYTPTAAYSGAPLYQNPTAVMYSSEQFPSAAQATAAATAGQLPQYPIGYPIGIGYPFNSTAYQNYWNQPITYYVPQTPIPSAGSAPILMPPPVSQTPANGGLMGAASTPISCNTGKRNTTPPGHGQQTQAQNQSTSGTPVPISPFATNLPVPLPDPAAGHMYAIPQPIYSNMLPFGGPMTPHPHHTATGGTIVNPLLPTATAAASTGYHPHSQSSHGNPESNTGPTNNAPTPQSTPSTPLSLPLSLPPHAKNTPLFATPPMLPNGYTTIGGGAGHHHYNNANAYEERKGNNNGSNNGYQGKRSNPNSGNYFSYSNNNSRQMTPNSSASGYQGNNNGGSQNQHNTGSNGPKNSSYANTSNTGNNQNSNNNGNGALMLGQPPKGQPRPDGQTNSVTKPPLIPTLPNSNSNTSSNTNPSDKTRINRSSKPPNLDLKRNFNNFNVNSRNTPSTNSTESNNSPNSITSSSVNDQQQYQTQHYQTHPHPYHQQSHGGGGSNQPHHLYYPPQHQHQQQQQPPYYTHRGGSVGSNNGGSNASGNGGNHAHQQTANAAAATAAAAAAAAAHTMPSSAIHSAAAVAAAACAAAIEPYHSQLIPLNAAGMSYVKIGQTYFTHPSLTLPPSRRSPPNDIRPIAGVYPTMNMMMPASRQFTPRPQHSSSFNKGSKAPR
ncbi:protein encore isoform X3 [Toxorhynchites rutilus septentrionalis]|uniref:protein encore isoform X3 n=1 Tax=Toxorhynchites rutilus septentrionalis TaxID=329112 RepID=UPI002478994B|nr:protein encore isoform X3 [Toxorhynchites rutilus septentrionalis]